MFEYLGRYKGRVALERLMDGEMVCRRDDGYAVYDQLFGLWLGGQ